MTLAPLYVTGKSQHILSKTKVFLIYANFSYMNAIISNTVHILTTWASVPFSLNHYLHMQRTRVTGTHS